MNFNFIHFIVLCMVVVLEDKVGGVVLIWWV